MIELKIKDFEAYHHYQPWYGKSVMSLLEKIDFKGLENKERQKIGSILGHMIQWKRFVVEKLKENRAFSILIDSVDDWPTISDPLSFEDFQKLLNEYKELHVQLLKELKNTSDFDEEVEDKYSKRYMALGIMQHDIYHIGQIALIAKG